MFKYSLHKIDWPNDKALNYTIPYTQLLELYMGGIHDTFLTNIINIDKL